MATISPFHPVCGSWDAPALITQLLVTVQVGGVVGKLLREEELVEPVVPVGLDLLVVPVEPVEPVEPVVPVGLDLLVVPVEPVEPVVPVGLVLLVVPVEPVEPVVPVGLVLLVVPVEPVVPVVPVEPVVLVVPVEPVGVGDDGLVVVVLFFVMVYCSSFGIVTVFVHTL
jgi:hypothetical protein